MYFEEHVQNHNKFSLMQQTFLGMKFDVCYIDETTISSIKETFIISFNPSFVESKDVF